MRREAVWWVVIVGWLALIGAGLWGWERFEATAGADHPRPDIAEAPGGWRLAVYVHPRCPCVPSTLGELAELMRQAPDLSARVVFVRPPGTGPGWEKGRNWDSTMKLAGVRAEIDEDGREARRVGAATAGLAVLTDPAGRVVFRGGLTPGRAREGAGPGRRAVLDWLAGRGGPADLPVYGCPLFADDD